MKNNKTVKKSKVEAKKDEKQTDVQSIQTEQLARVLADYANLQKRVERERKDLWQVMVARFALKVLPVYDMLLGAQKHLQDTGVAITLDEFKKILQEEGVEEIIVLPGDTFNEDYCEAIDTVATDNKGEVNKIAEVVAKGFKMVNGFVIRPVKVKVFKSS